MTQPNQSKEELLPVVRARLKELLVSHLALEDIQPEEIGDDTPLFGEGLGLDSLDAVEIVVLLQRNFGLNTKDTEKGAEIFQSVNTLAKFVIENSPNPLGTPAPSAPEVKE